MVKIKKYKPTTPSRRYMTVSDFSILTKKKPEKTLSFGMRKKGGRSKGQITVRHQGGGHKRKYRIIDFKRNKFNIPAEVKALEYDPNRTAHLALLDYQDKEKRYIIAPVGIKIGNKIISSKDKIEVKPGNHLCLKYMPVGTLVHNLELVKGRGGQIVRSAGSSAQIIAKEKSYVQVKLPSSEIRNIPEDCMATVGQVSNPEHATLVIGKAGRKRWLGIRPTVRGKAMAPVAHPHGGGEGRSPIGLIHPKTPWGKPALGYKTRKKKNYSNRFIVKRRK